MTLCTGDLVTPQRKSSDVHANIHSAFRISTFQLRTVFALDVLLARCPIEPSQRMKDILPSLLSQCTLISSPSWFSRTRNSNMLSPSTMISPLTPGLWHCAPKPQPLQLQKISQRWCMFNTMCTSQDGCLMLAENISPIYLIEHSLKRGLKYTKVLHGYMQNGHAK